MLKKRSTKLTCLLIAFLWTTVIVGSSYAYFIDSVNVTGNVITSGNLKAAMSWKNPGETEWQDASKGAIFNYQRWEPGYTDVKYIKMENTGSLAFQYELNVFPAELLTGHANLLEVIDVYYKEGVTDVTRANYAEKLTRVGTLMDLLTNAHGAAYGILLPEEGKGSKNAELPAGVEASKGSVEACLVLHMQEDAGNEYMGLSVGDGFKVQLYATQYMYENDSFGNTYDKDAESKLLKPLDIPTSMIIDVTPVNGLVPYDVWFNDPVNGVSATVPQGAKMAAGATSLKLVVEAKKNSEAKVNVTDDEELFAYNVKVVGLADDNTVPVVINMGEVLPVGLNLGNYSLYHVENGVTTQMTLVESAALDAHNEFTYDPVTGEVAVAMATFSEVTLVADTTKAWEGNFDYSWYTNEVALADGESATEYIIANADQLAAFGAIVGGMDGQTQDSFSGKTVKLLADINLGDKDNANESLIFYPIGYYYTDDKNADGTTGDYYSTVNSFEGTFDGNGHTIANFYQNTWEIKGDYDGNYYSDAMGLFGYVVNGKVCNLTVDNFSSDGEFTPTGVIAAYAVNSTFENIAITNCNPRVYNTGNGGIVGIGGNSDDPDTYKLTFTNITIDNSNIISALWGSWDVACGGLVGMFRGAGHVYMTNCHVAAQMDVYNDVCGNYQYYWYRYSGMMVGTNKNMTTDENGYTVPETKKFHAENCTVHFGNWNDYYYCEFVDNSIASYTHDYQFSRVEKSEIIFDENGKAIGCTHDHTKGGYETTDIDGDGIIDSAVLKEDKTAVYLPFNQLFTGYGWGVKHIPVFNGEDYAFEGITILDREVADSVEKFESKFTGDFLYRVGNQNTVSLGSLFAAKDGATIIDSGVVVNIVKVNEDMNASGEYTKSTTENWEDGKIQFSGTGVVKVTIQDYNFCTPTVLYLEVVDATNVTAYSGLGNRNSVLLNDITMSSGGSYALSGATLFGNGFTFDVRNGAFDGSGYMTSNYLVGIRDATLDNVKIVGKVYEDFSGTTANQYNRACVYVSGNCVIANSYISNCASPIRVGTGAGTKLYIKNTTLKGGSFCNMDMRGGDVVIDGLTTINQVGANDKSDSGKEIVGLGIVVYFEGPTGTETIKIIGDGLTQNNYLADDQTDNVIEIAKDYYDSIFIEGYYKEIGGQKWVNAGILSLQEAIGKGSIDTPAGYDWNDEVSLLGTDGHLCTMLSATIPDSIPSPKEWSADEQYPVAPKVSFEYPTGEGKKNYQTQTEDGQSYCYYDSATESILIGFEKGASFVFDSDILTATKLGNVLDTDCSIDPAAGITDKKISFTAAGEYTITYQYDDPYNYRYSGGGGIECYTVEDYEKAVTVRVTEMDKAIPPATFDFNEKGSKQVTIGTTTYVMPNVTTTGDTIASMTKSGTTVYYPLVYVKYSENGSTTLKQSDSSTSLTIIGNNSATAFCPVFDSVVTITDNGTTYGSNTTTMADEKLQMISDHETVLKWSSSNSVPTDNPVVNSNVLYFQSSTIAGINRDPTTYVFEYVYTDDAGNVYHYYIGYIFPATSKTCVTPDTLVTLADGSKKEIQHVTYEDQLLVWDFYKGEYAVAPAAIISNHGYGENTVIALTFSDGTVVKVVNTHAFVDLTLNDTVSIDAETVESYVGHSFAKASGDGYEAVTLTSYTVSTEMVEAWGVLTAGHFNCITEDMISFAGSEQELAAVDYFEYGDGLKYDEAAMQADIDQYGTYTYEEFADLVTPEQFEAVGIANMKVTVGKGKTTYDYILHMIDTYLK